MRCVWYKLNARNDPSMWQGQRESWRFSFLRAFQKLGLEEASNNPSTIFVRISNFALIQKGSESPPARNTGEFIPVPETLWLQNFISPAMCRYFDLCRLQKAFYILFSATLSVSRLSFQVFRFPPVPPCGSLFRFGILIKWAKLTPSLLLGGPLSTKR